MPFDANNVNLAPCVIRDFWEFTPVKYNKIQASNGPGYILSGLFLLKILLFRNWMPRFCPKPRPRLSKKMFSRRISGWSHQFWLFRFQRRICACWQRALRRPEKPRLMTFPCCGWKKPGAQNSLKTICAIISERLFPPSPGPGTGRERLRP